MLWSARSVAAAMRYLLIAMAILLLNNSDKCSLAADSVQKVIGDTQPKIVKIYGAGGFTGLEAYQSGFLVSKSGHVLTVFSYVLDTDDIRVVLSDGHRYQAKIINVDPHLELAVLKIEAEGLPHFSLGDSPLADSGTRVLAFSNIYGVASGNENASVLHGIVSTVAKLNARRGAYQTPYQGKVYVLDAITNNPGAAGGALTDHRGRLLGMLGKELRNSTNGTWLNYAIPLSELHDSAVAIMAGKKIRSTNSERRKPDDPLDLTSIGITLVPDVLPRTPPFIDQIKPDSPAAAAGLRPDDLLLLINDQLVQSCKGVDAQLTFLDRADAVNLTVLRDKKPIEVELKAP